MRLADVRVAVLGDEVLADGIRSTLIRGGFSVEHPTDVATWAERTPGTAVVVAPVAALDDALIANGSAAGSLVVIATAVDPSPRVFGEALRSGASAVVDPLQDCFDFSATIEAVLSGSCRLPISVARWFAEHAIPDCPIVLTEHELRLMRVLAHGDSIALVSDQHGYSERTMHRILRTLYTRLGVGNRSQAIALVAWCGLLAVESAGSMECSED